MNDLGQTALVAVIAVSVIVALIGATLVATVVQSFPLQQAAAVSVYAHRALQAGENAYVTAVNANPTLAQCNTGTNRDRRVLRSELRRVEPGERVVHHRRRPPSTTPSAIPSRPSIPPPTRSPTCRSRSSAPPTHPHTTTNYVFQSETINLAANNGFLTNVWWSNYESYTGSGNYSNCNYNWKINYDINGGRNQLRPGLLRSPRLPVRTGLHQRLGVRQRQRHADGRSVVR